MRIAQLIEYLQTQPPDLQVVVSGYEGGYNDISILKIVHLQPDTSTKWWDGQHSGAHEGEPALLLAGENRLSEEFLQEKKGGEDEF